MASKALNPMNLFRSRKLAVVIGGAGTLLVAAIWMRLFPSLYRRDTLSVRTA